MRVKIPFDVACSESKQWYVVYLIPTNDKRLQAQTMEWKIMNELFLLMTFHTK